MASSRDKRGKPKPVLVKAQARRNLNEATLWMLPKTEKIRDSKYYHTVACGDLYVLYSEFTWYYHSPIHDLIPDCTMVYKGSPIHFEVDRGNESMDILFAKIEKYIKYSQHNDKTIFVLVDGVRSAKTTGNNLHSYLVDRRRGRQFSWTTLDMLKADPFGKWLFNSLLEQISLDELCSTS